MTWINFKFIRSPKVGGFIAIYEGSFKGAQSEYSGIGLKCL